MAEHWLTDRPAQTIRTADVTLTRAGLDDLGDLLEAVNGSLDELRPWMPWAQVPATRASLREFLEQGDRHWRTGHEFQFAIRGSRGGSPDALLGFCGLHDRVGPGGLEIGYWVRSDCTGRGVATSAASGLTFSALGLEDVHRVEIHCDAANGRSAAIPPKLGYRLDRVELRPPTAPGETDRHMIWVFGRGADPGRS